MNGLTRTDTSQVTVALVGEHQAVGPHALDACGHGGCTAVGSLVPVNVDIVVCEDGATYWRHAHTFLLHTHFLYHLCYELMYHTV